ncbi:hypothetical protein ACUZ9P_08225 [Desulfovibrio sp. QI0430]
MIITYRHFCASARVLEVYQSTESGCDYALPSTESLSSALRNAVKLSLRTEHVDVPDHQHQNRREQAFTNTKSLAGMLLTALGATDGQGNVSSEADCHCLEVNHGRIYVRANRLEDWQHEITAYQSPLPVMAAAWLRRCLREHVAFTAALKPFCEFFNHSTLPGVHDQRLNDLIKNGTHKRGRLCESHMHINGSTEFTPTWVHSLANHKGTYRELEKARKKGPSKERVGYFFDQLRTSPLKILHRLRTATILRVWLCQLLLTQSSCGQQSEQSCHSGSTDGPSYNDLTALLRGCTNGWEFSRQHPFEHSDLPAGMTDVQREAAMWLFALWKLHESKDHFLAILMHVYMLLMHQHLRLLVQQPEQYGFDQFQYITLAGAREAAEDVGKPGFEARFRQFYGMHGPDMAHVEARFAPKDDPQKMDKLLRSIWKGYIAATEQASSKGIEPCPTCPRIAGQFRICNGVVHCAPDALEGSGKPYTLGLVAHFIKQPDTKKGRCRHQALRDTMAKQARTLIARREVYRKSSPDLYAAIIGKDAASNEQDTSPEVFAPVFRHLHIAGITRTTFHAGEDFEHILTGIRAVHEAIRFLNMGSGDRIGHATALGLAPEQCRIKIFYCKQGLWLDSLVWLTWLLEQKPELRAFGGEICSFRQVIERLYFNIYGKDCPQLHVLWKAWELRKYDLRSVTEDDFEAITPQTRHERDLLRQEKAECGERLYAEACRELELYHAAGTKKSSDFVRCKDCDRKKKMYGKWDEVITLKPEELPGADLIRAVQDAIIREMLQKDIVVEVLPTSNVRISHYEKTEEHHIMRWLNFDDKRPAPQVVLGTDDPGIFSTSLRNEYSLILNKLKELYPGRCEKPYDIINHLIENGLSYRFTA